MMTSLGAGENPSRLNDGTGALHGGSLPKPKAHGQFDTDVFLFLQQ
jgi:hypothetical protein